MTKMEELSSKPDTKASRGRPALDPWIVIGLILLLIIVLILIDLHIRRDIEGPGRLLQNNPSSTSGDAVPETVTQKKAAGEGERDFRRKSRLQRKRIQVDSQTMPT